MHISLQNGRIYARQKGDMRVIKAIQFLSLRYKPY